MSLARRIQEDLLTALKSGDKLTTSVLRMAKSAFQYEQVAKTGNLDEADEIAVLSRLIKQRKEAADAFRQGGADQRASQEEAEIEILRRYMPEPMSEEEIRDLATSVTAELGASGPQDFGAVMKAVMSQVKGRADGKTVNRIVKEILGG